MTPHEIELATALGRCGGWVGLRFMYDISRAAKNAPDDELTLRQRHYMEILAWRYRRQLPTHLVPDAQPLPMPKGVKPPKVGKPKPENTPEPETGDLFALVSTRDARSPDDGS